MRRLILSTDGFTRGKFALTYPNGLVIADLGDKVAIVLRRVLREDEPVQGLRYIVEIIRSSIHDADKRPTIMLVSLEVPIGNGTDLCSRVWPPESFGQLHTLGVQPYTVDGETGYVMTINGLLYDGEILHVKDIIV